MKIKFIKKCKIIGMCLSFEVDPTRIFCSVNSELEGKSDRANNGRYKENRKQDLKYFVVSEKNCISRLVFQFFSVTSSYLNEIRQDKKGILNIYLAKYS